jgi:hypothetical protein
MQLNKPVYYTILFIVISVSFYFYAPIHYAWLTSDDALSVLMAHYYKLPNDLYCWGQDRGGTLISLMGWVLKRTLNTSAILSVSIANYIVLGVGFIGYSSLFKKQSTKLLLAVIWFLPFQRFVDIIRYPIGMEYSLIGFGIFLINQSFKNSSSIIKQYTLLALGLLQFVLAIWVSDLALVTLSVLMGVAYFYYVYNQKKYIPNKTILLAIMLAIVACVGFISYAKSFATRQVTEYLFLNNWQQIKQAFQTVIQANVDVFVFKTNEPAVSLYAWLLVLFIGLLIAHILKNNALKKLLLNKWTVFFLIDFFAIIGVFFISHWVLANGMGRWYFVASYISFALFVLSLFDADVIKPNKPLGVLLIFILIVGVVSPIYTMKTTRHHSLKPTSKVVKELEQLGEIGLIGEYWNAYINSVNQPELIKATPHDASDVRNLTLAAEVISRENIYVVRDMWMRSFPDSIQQFGVMLYKDGQEFEMANSKLCKYKK